MHNLEVIEIKNNPGLYYIDPYAFYDTLSNDAPNIIKTIDLSNNALTQISETLLLWNTTEQVNLNGNPYDCDCLISWMINKSSTLRSKYLTCSSPDELKNRLINSLKNSELKCHNGM